MCVFPIDPIPSQFLETHKRDERFNFVLPSQQQRQHVSSESKQAKKNVRMSYAGRPIYKHYQKYPYYG